MEIMISYTDTFWNLKFFIPIPVHITWSASIRNGLSSSPSEMVDRKTPIKIISYFDDKLQCHNTIFHFHCISFVYAKSCRNIQVNNLPQDNLILFWLFQSEIFNNGVLTLISILSLEILSVSTSITDLAPFLK